MDPIHRVLDTPGHHINVSKQARSKSPSSHKSARGLPIASVGYDKKQVINSPLWHERFRALAKHSYKRVAGTCLYTECRISNGHSITYVSA